MDFMFRIGRDKPDKKEFLKIVNPISTWVINCKNPLFETVSSTFKNDPKSGMLDFEVQFFFADGDNNFVMLYQFYQTDKILKIKEHIKDILKSKSMTDFERIMVLLNKFN